MAGTQIWAWHGDNVQPLGTNTHAVVGSRFESVQFANAAGATCLP